LAKNGSEKPVVKRLILRVNCSVLHNLFFKAIFGQDYPNLGRVMQHTSKLYA